MKEIPTLAFGSSQVSITPREPVPLAGFEYRNNKPFMSIASDIYLKAFVFQIDDRTKCLLIADILWWPPELINAIRQNVQKTWGIDPTELLLHATHTHCAPQISSQFTSGLGVLREDWQKIFLTRLHHAIAAAMKTLRPGHLFRFRGQSQIAMNRRIDKRIDLPTEQWPQGEIDHELNTLLIQGADGEPLGVLVHYACHPTILRGAEVSAEFPGVMCDVISRNLGPSCVVGFLQGCCGDAGPVIEHTGSVANDTFQGVLRVGNQLAEDALRSLTTQGEIIIPDSTTGKLTEVQLPYDSLPSRDELIETAMRDDHIGEWARLLLGRLPLAPAAHLEIQRLPLGSHLTLTAFNAEMVTHYGLLVKSLSGGTALPCGYSNGMTGYVVTDTQLMNGGYEVDESTKYFGLPSRFAKGNEQVLENALRSELRSTP